MALRPVRPHRLKTTKGINETRYQRSSIRDTEIAKQKKNTSNCDRQLSKFYPRRRYTVREKEKRQIQWIEKALVGDRRQRRASRRIGVPHGEITIQKPAMK